MYKLTSTLRSEYELLISVLDKYASVNPYTRIYTIGKTLLAVGLLVTLCFNDIPTLFVRHLFNKNGNDLMYQINLFTLFSYNSLWIPKCIAISVLILTISGYFPQLSGILHWWVSYSFFTGATIVDGGDQINANLTLLLVPITLMDNRLNSWSGTSKGFPAKNLAAWMFFFFIEIQGAFLYLQSSLEKPYKLEEWRDGTAIYYWFNNNIFGAPNFMLKVFNPILTNSYVAFVLTWVVILLELCLFGAFFMAPKRRARLFIPAIIFHFLILVFLGLTSFFFSITGLLVLYLLNRKTAFEIYEREAVGKNENATR